LDRSGCGCAGRSDRWRCAIEGRRWWDAGGGSVATHACNGPLAPSKSVPRWQVRGLQLGPGRSWQPDIWVQDLPTGMPVRITTDPAADEDASIAPDGSAVVFRSERNGGGIYLAKVPGGSERLLVPGGRDPRFSPDGGSIVYWVGDRDETVASGRLFLLSLAGGSSVRLVQDFVDARFPVWSPDGQYILFMGCRMGNQPLPMCSEWWVTSLDQTRVQNTGGLALLRKEQILPMDVGGWYRNAILFSGRRGATTSLWELPIFEANLRASGKPQQLTAGDAREVDASLADNGTIAFEHFTAAPHIWCIAHASNPKIAVVSKVIRTRRLIFL